MVTKNEYKSVRFSREKRTGRTSLLEQHVIVCRQLSLVLLFNEKTSEEGCLKAMKGNHQKKKKKKRMEKKSVIIFISVMRLKK